MTTTYKLANCWEEIRWRSHAYPWAQLKWFLWGYLVMFYGDVLPRLNWLQNLTLFVVVWLPLYLLDRATRSSVRLQNRAKIEKGLSKRYESYVSRKMLWISLGMFAYFTAIGKLLSSSSPLLYGAVFGLINQLIWMRKGIDEQTYQLPDVAVAEPN